MDPSMSVSPAGVRRIEIFEGRVRKLYRDEVGIWTIGCGHRCSIDECTKYAGVILTDLEIDRLFIADTARIVRCLNETIDVPLTVPEFDACCSLAFNIGEGDADHGWRSSTVLRMLNALDFIAAAESFRMWNKVTVDGKLVASANLTQRRLLERAWFLEGTIDPQLLEQARISRELLLQDLTGEIRDISGLVHGGDDEAPDTERNT